MICPPQARLQQGAGFQIEAQSRSLGAEGNQEVDTALCEATLTFVDLVEFANDVQSDLRELVLEEVEKKREKVFDCGLFPKQRCEAAYLGGESRPNML